MNPTTPNGKPQRTMNDLLRRMSTELNPSRVQKPSLIERTAAALNPPKNPAIQTGIFDRYFDADQSTGKLTWKGAANTALKALNPFGSIMRSAVTNPEKTIRRTSEMAGRTSVGVVEMGQGQNQSFAALGAKASKLFDIDVNKQGPLDYLKGIRDAQFTPEGQFQQDVYGSEEPIDFTSIGAQITNIFGEKDRPYVNPIIGGSIAIMDVATGGGASKSLKVAARNIAKLNKAEDIVGELVKIVKGSDDEIMDMARRFEDVTDAKQIEREITGAAEAAARAPKPRPQSATEAVQNLLREQKSMSAKAQGSEMDILGKEALTPDEFAKLKQANGDITPGGAKAVDGVVPPSGSYDADGYVSIGKNAPEQESVPYADRVYYHGLSGRRLAEFEKTGRIPKAQQAFGGEFSITDDFDIAKGHAGEKGRVVEVRVTDDVDVKMADPFSENLDEIDDIGHLMDIGEAEFLVYDTSKIRVNRPLGAAKNADIPPGGAKVADDAMPPMKERQFGISVKESPNVKAEVKAGVGSQYEVYTDQRAIDEANALIKQNYDEALRFARDTSKEATKHQNTVRMLLAYQAQEAGRIDEAVELFETVNRTITSPAQALQSLAMFGRLSPEGVLRYTAKIFDKANDKIAKGRKFTDKGEIKRVVGKNIKKLKISDEMGKEYAARAKKISAMPDGEDKLVASAELLRDIQSNIPASILRKIATIQAMSQLLNPKTAIRNIVGNFGFAVIENVSDVVGAALDTPLSFVLGKRRTKMMPTLDFYKAQWKGAKEGFRQGLRDAKLGIDTSGLTGQLDLPNTNVFKGKVMKSFQRWMNYELKAIDRAMYQAAFEGSLYNQMKAAGVLEPTDAMREIAVHDGMYRTFQDDNITAKAFVGLKRTLNLHQEFGIGDVVIKYPKTPANLLNRGVAYSPAGFVNTVFQASKPLFGYPFDQRKFVESFSRALVGSTGLVGTGAILHRLGIISGKREKDRDVAATQRATGLGQYKINASALKRFVASGFDADAAKIEPGDTLYSFDWFQPAAIGVAIGANLDEGADVESIVTVAINGIASGIDTLAEQPLTQNLSRIMKFGDASDAIVKTAQQIPASFVPTFLNQIRQLTDNTQRNVYDPDVIQYSWNVAKSRIPGASRTLQPMISPYGENNEVYQNGSNNPLNVLFNPAFKTVYTPTPEADMVLDLFAMTGETKQMPRVMNTSQVVNGERVKLTPTQVTALQRFVGTATKNAFHSVASDPNFQALPNEDKVKYLSNILTDIGKAGKIVVLGDRPNKLTTRVKKLLASMYGTN